MAKAKRNQQTGKTVLEKRRAKQEKRRQRDLSNQKLWVPTS